MIYSALAREVWTRLQFHAKTGLGDAVPILDGLRIVKSGEFRIDQSKHLPIVTLVDFTGRESSARGDGRLTLFLKTERKHEWVRTDGAETPGLLDWMEAIMDAVELAPSTGQPDLLLTLHRDDGTVLPDNHGQPLALLSEPLTWDYRMSEITDMSFLMELDIAFTLPKGRRANRRTSPVPRTAYETV